MSYHFHLDDHKRIRFYYRPAGAELDAQLSEGMGALAFREEHASSLDAWLLRAMLAGKDAVDNGDITVFVNGNLAYWQRLREELATTWDELVLEAVLLEIAGVQTGVCEARPVFPSIGVLIPEEDGQSRSAARLGMDFGDDGRRLMHWAVLEGGRFQTVHVSSEAVRESLDHPWGGFPLSLPLSPAEAVEKAARELACPVGDCRSIDLQFRRCDEGSVWRYFVEFGDCGAVVLLTGEVRLVSSGNCKPEAEYEAVRRKYGQRCLKDLRVRFEENFSEQVAEFRHIMNQRPPSWGGWAVEPPPLSFEDAIRIAAENCLDGAERVVACDLSRDSHDRQTPWYYLVWFDDEAWTAFCLVDMLGCTYVLQIGAPKPPYAGRRRMNRRGGWKR